MVFGQPSPLLIFVMLLALSKMFFAIQRAALFLGVEGKIQDERLTVDHLINVVNFLEANIMIWRERQAGK